MKYLKCIKSLHKDTSFTKGKQYWIGASAFSRNNSDYFPTGTVWIYDNEGSEFTFFDDVNHVQDTNPPSGDAPYPSSYGMHKLSTYFKVK
jgi:hypothetical protein